MGKHTEKYLRVRVEPKWTEEREKSIEAALKTAIAKDATIG